MKKNVKIIGALLFASLSMTTLSMLHPFEAKMANAYYAPGTTYENGDKDTYYNSINDTLSGDSLLSALRSLNLSRRKKTIGYSAMGTSASNSAFIYTDYDPNYTEIDKNGQVYGTKILSFYSGTSTTSWNREHVWPNSRGGGSGGNVSGPYVDADIYMPRPTIAAENSNRGNSPYIEGMSNSSSGWDPVTAFGKDGCYQGENIRGECARIIFYCMTAHSQLVLDEGNSSNGKNMGKLSDMLKWNLLYPVNEREINRQEGGEYLQGNRNAFVDHPEYACKIWGDTNADTKEICAKYAPSTLESLTINKTSDTLVYEGTTQLTVTPTPNNASNAVTWKSSNENVATVNSSGLVTAKNIKGATVITATSTVSPDISASCTITVTEPANVAMTSISTSPLNISINTSEQIVTTINPANAYPKPTLSYQSNDTSVAVVNSSGVVTGLKDGNAIITITATQGSVIKTADCQVTVVSSMHAGTWTKATSISEGDYVVFGYDGGTGKQVTAGALSETYLSKVDTTIVDNKITSLSDSTLIFEVGGSTDNYTFKDITSNKLLCSSKAKNVNFNNSGVSTWKVTFGSSTLIKSTTSSYGSLQYNSSSPRFTTYTSSQNEVTIYKKETVSSYGATEFANDLLNLTNDICLDSENNGFKNVSSSLAPIWETLQDINHYQKLSDSDKHLLAVSTANENGTIIEQAMARYDHIVSRYGFINFINDRPISMSNINHTIKINVSTNIVIIAISIISVLGLSMFIILKKKHK